MAEGTSVGQALDAAAGSLAGAGVERPRLDAELMLAHVLGVGRERIFGYPEKILAPAQHGDFANLVSQRRNRRPLAQVLGRREFWSRAFRVTPDTLCPRPDSETLIEAALEALTAAQKRAPLRLLDLGTGGGCLLLTLLAELAPATGLGIDISEAAVRIAAENAGVLGLADRARFVVGDWCGALRPGQSPGGGGFNLIVTNPPYLSERALKSLAPEVARHEPPRALLGGEDGLSAYRRVAPGLAPILADKGMAILEVGDGQAPRVANILRLNGLQSVRFYRDLSGIRRCIVARAM